MPNPIVITEFGGVRPRIQPELLSPSDAQVAINCNFDNGGIKPFNDPLAGDTLTGGNVVDSSSNQVIDSNLDNVVTGQSNYMYLVDGASASAWIGFSDNDINVVSSIIDNTDGRFYYTGDGLPSQSDYTLAMSNNPPPYPGDFYRLGVPAPTTKLTQALVGTPGATVVSTAYVYTYVTVWGEESAPSPTTDNIDVDFITGNTITLSDFLLPTDTDLNIDAIRIYRINSGTATSEYQFIEEVVADNTLGVEEIDSTAVASYTYSDDTLEVDLGESIVSTNWDTPPATLEGLTMVFNGVLGGFVNNTLYMSEPYYPYAWPSAYEITFPADIVGIGFTQGSIAILTEGNPHMLIGSDPATLSKQPLPYPQPCVSHRSIVSTDRGVIYASQQGLFQLSVGGGVLLTEDHFTDKQWKEKSISSINGTYFDNKYYGIFNGTSDGFIFDLGNNTWTDIHTSELDLKYITTDGVYVYLTAASGSTYSSYIWDGAETILPLEWKSKRFKELSSTSYSIGRVHTNGTAYIQMYVDGVLSHMDITNEELFRLTPVRGHEFEVGLKGTSDVQSIIIGTSVQEISNNG